jgi:hypothetical protein
MQPAVFLVFSWMPKASSMANANQRSQFRKPEVRICALEVKLLKSGKKSYGRQEYEMSRPKVRDTQRLRN